MGESLFPSYIALVWADLARKYSLEIPMRTAEEGGQEAKRLLDGDFQNGDPMTLSLVEARPQIFRTPSIARCPIIARDLLPEANTHAYNTE